MIQALVFYMFAAITVASGVMVISARNPVHAVLYLILAFFNAAGLFLLCGAEFLAMVLVVGWLSVRLVAPPTPATMPVMVVPAAMPGPETAAPTPRFEALATTMLDTPDLKVSMVQAAPLPVFPVVGVLSVTTWPVTFVMVVPAAMPPPVMVAPMAIRLVLPCNVKVD